MNEKNCLPFWFNTGSSGATDSLLWIENSIPFCQRVGEEKRGKKVLSKSVLGCRGYTEALYKPRILTEK